MRGRVSGVVEGMDEKGKVKGMVVVVIGEIWEQRAERAVVIDKSRESLI